MSWQRIAFRRRTTGRRNPLRDNALVVLPAVDFLFWCVQFLGSSVRSPGQDDHFVAVVFQE